MSTVILFDTVMAMVMALGKLSFFMMAVYSSRSTAVCTQLYTWSQVEVSYTNNYQRLPMTFKENRYP